MQFAYSLMRPLFLFYAIILPAAGCCMVQSLIGHFLAFRFINPVSTETGGGSTGNNWSPMCRYLVNIPEKLFQIHGRVETLFFAEDKNVDINF